MVCMAKLHLPPKEFHLLSRVLLRRFAGYRGLLATLDPRHPNDWVRRKGPRAVCFTRDIKPDDPFAFEERWQPVEQHLPDAMSAVEAGTIFADDHLVGVLRRCLALHFSRSRTIELMSQAISPQMLENARERMLIDPLLTTGSGLVLTGDEGRAIMADDLVERVKGLGFRPEKQVPNHFIYYFALISRQLEGQPIEISVAMEGEFLIGDAPALTLDHQKGFGVPWMQANTHLMPLGRRHLIATGPTNRIFAAPSHFVESVNRAQVRSAHHHVMWHPDADLEAFVRTEIEAIAAESDAQVT